MHLDTKCKNLPIKNLMSEAFFRNEREGYRIIIPEGYTQNETLIVNSVAGKVIDSLFSNAEPTPALIVDDLRRAFPEVERTKIQNDVFDFLGTLVDACLIEIEGVEEMYTGETICTIGDYEVYSAREGDLKDINNALSSGRLSLGFKHPDSQEDAYAPIYTRSRVFGYLEEFYLLKDQRGEASGIIGILHGKIVLHNIPLVGIFAIEDSILDTVCRDFIKTVVDHFFESIIHGGGKLRATMPVENARGERIRSLFKESGFVESAYLKDELGIDKDVSILDCLH